MFRLFLDADYTAILVELDDAIALRVADMVTKNGCPLFAGHGRMGQGWQAVAEKDIVAQYQAGIAACYVLLGQQKGLRQAFRSGLDHIFYGAPPLLSVMEQGFVQGRCSGVEMRQISRIPAIIKVARG